MTSDPLVDLNRLDSWMRDNVVNFTGPISVAKIEGGQSNPTFRLDTPSKSYVLRRKPAGQLLKSAHAVDREFRVQSALAQTDVPTAHMHALCQDPDVLGADFYVMDYIKGRSFDDPRMPSLDPKERREIMTDMNLALAKIHSVDLFKVGLEDYGPKGHYVERQVTRWTAQYRATETETVRDMDDLMDWLSNNMIPDDGQRTLVHGDYRIDNLLYDPTQPKILAILDWELSTLGHPFADLASVIMQWQMPAGGDGRGLAGVDRANLGLMTDQEFVDLYCANRDIPAVENFSFYLAFCFFRMAAILQGVKKRALDGNASDPGRGLTLGEYVPLFARMGLKAATQ